MCEFAFPLSGNRSVRFRQCSCFGFAARPGMRSKVKMTGRLVAAARALTGISQEDFAIAAGLPAETIASMEVNGSAWLDSESHADAVYRAFEVFGVIAIGEDDGMGAGV